jgi:hypothetical protein
MPQPAGFSFTTTAQDIINASSQDIRQQLGTTGADANILLDYTNRVQLEILRRSRWQYSLSAIQRFITELEQTDYWIGPTGQGPAGSVDTGLNLTNVFRIQKDSFFDRSNYRQLTQIANAPNLRTTQLRDGLGRPGLPAVFRSDPTNPNLIQLYPPANNENSATPVPYSPIVSTTTTGGALAGRIYFVRCSFLDSEGNEGTASDSATRVWVPAGQLATVLSPNLPFASTASGASYTKYNVYASEILGDETLQNASPITLGTNWTEPTSGLINGVNPPSQSALEPLGGYLMEFRFFQSRPQLASATTVLSIPDDYKDIVIAGVNALAFALAEKMQDMVQYWTAKYDQGVAQMIADKNLFPSGPDFIRPDNAAIQTPSFGSISVVEIFNS